MTPRGESYKCQQKRPWLKKGVVVWVQPGTIATKPYKCIIVEQEVNWSSGSKLELCTYLPGRHAAVIWEYWADRLTPANKFFTFWMRLFYRFEQMITSK